MARILPEEIDTYSEQHTSELDSLYDTLAQVTRDSMKYHHMQVGKVEGAFLRMLARLTNARHILEIGTFTGYSALCLAEGMEDGGRLITCDVDPEATDIAKQHWARSPHGSKIELRLGPALETIAALEGPWDLVFIDADKQNYIHYWEAVMPKVRQGGLLVADNVLWSGRVVNPQKESDFAVDRFNKHVVSDPRVEAVLLTVRDGITLAWKK